MMISDSERREVARSLRGARYGWHSWERALYDALGVDTETVGLDMLDRLADFIEPEPHAEEIVAKAYRAAADQIDWELGDTPRVMALRERADELERMAHERDVAMKNHEPTRNCSESTRTYGECDRDALLALAKVLHDMGNQYEAHKRYELGTTFRAIAARIREALGVVDE